MSRYLNKKFVFKLSAGLLALLLLINIYDLIEPDKFIDAQLTNHGLSSWVLLGFSSDTHKNGDNSIVKARKFHKYWAWSETDQEIVTAYYNYAEPPTTVSIRTVKGVQFLDAILYLGLLMGTIGFVVTTLNDIKNDTGNT